MTQIVHYENCEVLVVFSEIGIDHRSLGCCSVWPLHIAFHMGQGGLAPSSPLRPGLASATFYTQMQYCLLSDFWKNLL